jgi:parallel beta-helix repeat protein
MSPCRLSRVAVLLGLIGVASTAELFFTDFNAPFTPTDGSPATGPVRQAEAQASAATIIAQAVQAGVGTIDDQGGSVTSGALLLGVDSSKAVGPWSAELVTGPIAISNSERDLAKLTLGFMLSVSSPQPVTVRIESLDEAGNVTGGLEGAVHPAAADFFQRFAVELSELKPTSNALFSPTAPAIRLSFGMRGSADGSGWAAAVGHELRLDNLSFASPAYYVSPSGSDVADGRSAATAFASPQRALTVAGPGDIILLMDGTYGLQADSSTVVPVANFVHAGTPARWITLKNHPGHAPLLSSAGQPAIGMALGTAETPSDVKLAYLEVRGLHIRGNGDSVREKFPGEIGQSTRNTDVRGINVNAVHHTGKTYHHLRFADNTIEFCTADGLYLDYADWFQVEHNHIRNNCATTREFAPAGLAVMHFANFDQVDDTTKILISGNHVSGNRLLSPNRKKGDQQIYFNGNGILLDANAEDLTNNGKEPPAEPQYYKGRTLVQNNLVVGNGGGGIQMWGSHRLDLINNTLYHNGTTPELKWGQVGMDMCHDVRLVNNVIVAQADRPLDTWMVKRIDRNTQNIYRANNVYFGGATPPTLGENDVVTDPQLVNPGEDPATADFRLKDGSPALHSGRPTGFVPPTDINGQSRAVSPSRGAYQ